MELQAEDQKYKQSVQQIKNSSNNNFDINPFINYQLLSQLMKQNQQSSIQIPKAISVKQNDFNKEQVFLTREMELEQEIIELKEQCAAKDNKLIKKDKEIFNLKLEIQKLKLQQTKESFLKGSLPFQNLFQQGILQNQFQQQQQMENQILNFGKLFKQDKQKNQQLHQKYSENQLGLDKNKMEEDQPLKEFQLKNIQIQEQQEQHYIQNQSNESEDNKEIQEQNKQLQKKDIKEEEGQTQGQLEEPIQYSQNSSNNIDNDNDNSNNNDEDDDNNQLNNNNIQQNSKKIKKIKPMKEKYPDHTCDTQKGCELLYFTVFKEKYTSFENEFKFYTDYCDALEKKGSYPMKPRNSKKSTSVLGHEDQDKCLCCSHLKEQLGGYIPLKYCSRWQAMLYNQKKGISKTDRDQTRKKVKQIEN